SGILRFAQNDKLRDVEQRSDLPVRWVERDSLLAELMIETLLTKFGMPPRSRFFIISCLLFPFCFCAVDLVAQQTPAIASTPSASPSPTPTVFSAQTLSELKQLQQTALTSDYAYRQVAHLANNIGPRLSGSAQAAKAAEYVASELNGIGCEVQLEKVMVPHW